MPVTPDYPGVYIQEISSGVRTITGVSTSITAFLGAAKRGPINKATRILSFADYERKFGGLDINSEMSYAVRQFFLNGGSDAYVVRLAKNADRARKVLENASSPTLNVLALDEGQAGNDIEVRVDYQTSNPGSTFNLTIAYISRREPTDNRVERFENLSMNSQSPRYVLRIVNGTSELVEIEDLVDRSSGTLNSLKGTSVSDELVKPDGTLIDVADLVDATHNSLRIVVNRKEPVEVKLDSARITGADEGAKLSGLCALIQDKVDDTHTGFVCERDGTRIRMISNEVGENSSVQVLPGITNDVSAKLKLGILSGGIETEAAAFLRPREEFARASLVSGPINSLFTSGSSPLTLPNATNQSLGIGLDSATPVTISLGDAPAIGSTFAAKLANVAARIQAAVRALQPNNPAYKDFNCQVTTATDITSNRATTQYRLVLVTGSPGASSAITVSPSSSNNILDDLNLATTSSAAKNLRLERGNEELYSDNEIYNLLFGSSSERKGIFALEAVDLFNLLCLPGVTKDEVLSEAAAYCEQRRAFLIADAPKDKDKPDEMVGHTSGLPKTEYGAVYYPWVYIADPLNNGKLRLSPPSGTIAGLYARTDSTRGVWKAPAGTEATLTGVQKVSYSLTDRENGILNPLGVNCIRIFPVYGAVAWGARTLRGANEMTSEYKYIPVRRLALYIEESLYRGLKWVVFEPNDEPLWSQIRLNVGAFMNNLFRQGAFQGKTPREAYFVKCDRETTTQNDINSGIVNILVGFAPLKPAEFVFVRIQQLAGQIAV